MCMSDISRNAWSEAIADDDAPFFNLLRKAEFLPKNRKKLFYQKFTESSKRITMCSPNIHSRMQMQLTNSGRAQRTYLEKHRLFNQMLGTRTAPLRLLVLQLAVFFLASVG